MKQIIIIVFSLFLNGNLTSQTDVICKDLDYLIELEKNFIHEQDISALNLLTTDYDIKYHRLEWNIDPAVKYISGTVTTFFEVSAPDFNQINFDLNDNMIVNDIIYHGDALNFALENDNLQINLPDIIGMGVIDSISVIYEGEPNSGGFGSFEIGTHNGMPVLWTLSEPYGAKSWWPCKQYLSDKIDSIDIIVTTPDLYRVGSNGSLVSEIELEDSLKTYHWKHRYPIPAYLISLAVSNYAVFTDYVHLDNSDSIPIVNYVFPENLATAKMQLSSTVEQMELYNQLFGVYPFANEKYGHAQFGWGGGMEHQTMSSMGGFSYGLQAHELAHQWFGDKVTCGSWEDIWLNEGSATYLAALTSEFLYPDTEDWNNWKKSTINQVTSLPDGSTWVNDTTSVSRIFHGRLSYKKGAMILHMLRWKMGDDNFFQGMRNYLDDPNLAYGFARTNDLKSHLENISGLDLEEFFQDWYYGQGYPSYTIKYAPRSDGISITVEQSTSHGSVDFFEMPIPVKVSNGAIDTTLVLDNTFSGQQFEFSLAFEPIHLEFDVDNWILSRDNSVEYLPTATGDIEILNVNINLIPNPASKSLEISIHDEVDLKNIRNIEIYDIHGKLIEVIQNMESSIQLDISSWSLGIYILKFRMNEGSIEKVMVKI